ncbi:hypothetical protein B0H11DRAFT_355840 [Mycena galericulata]|nr:hypothetical protein B0H11DRAFT_355840 [Mycena galericulata]
MDAAPWAKIWEAKVKHCWRKPDPEILSLTRLRYEIGTQEARPNLWDGDQKRQVFSLIALCGIRNQGQFWKLPSTARYMRRQIPGDLCFMTSRRNLRAPKQTQTHGRYATIRYTEELGARTLHFRSTVYMLHLILRVSVPAGRGIICPDGVFSWMMDVTVEADGGGCANDDLRSPPRTPFRNTKCEFGKHRASSPSQLLDLSQRCSGVETERTRDGEGEVYLGTQWRRGYK